MPTIIETKVYTFDELSDGARQKARDWYTEGNDFDHESVYDMAAEAGKKLGISLRTKPVKLMNGSTRYDPAIYFSGFSSQGDGACYEGSYRFAYGAPKAVREEFPKDVELHRIADALLAVQRPAFYGLSATITTSGRYSHSGTMQVEVEHLASRDVSMTQSDEVTQLLRDFADWIYARLRDEYFYSTSDEVVDETILANGYTFTEAGRRFG